jgi:hypothetical protein
VMALGDVMNQSFDEIEMIDEQGAVVEGQWMRR